MQNQIQSEVIAIVSRTEKGCPRSALYREMAKKGYSEKQVYTAIIQLANDYVAYMYDGKRKNKYGYGTLYVRKGDSRNHWSWFKSVR